MFCHHCEANAGMFESKIAEESKHVRSTMGILKMNFSWSQLKVEDIGK
jgi:hypothetical protein